MRRCALSIKLKRFYGGPLTIGIGFFGAWFTFTGWQKLADDFIDICDFGQLFWNNLFDDMGLNGLMLWRRILYGDQFLVLVEAKRQLKRNANDYRFRSQTIWPFPTSMTAFTWC